MIINWQCELPEPPKRQKNPSIRRTSVAFSLLVHLVVLALMLMEFTSGTSPVGIDKTPKRIQAHLVYAPKLIKPPQQGAKETAAETAIAEPAAETTPAEAQPPSRTEPAEPDVAEADKTPIPSPLPEIEQGPLPAATEAAPVRPSKRIDFSSLGVSRRALSALENSKDQALLGSVVAETRAQRETTRPAQARNKSYDQLTSGELIKSAKVSVDCKDGAKKALVAALSIFAGGNTRCYRAPEHQSHIDKRLERLQPKH